MLRGEPATTVEHFGSTADVFGIEGVTVRAHKGRSVVKIRTNTKTYYLKRYWLAPSQMFKRHVTRGFHELRMIDWLNNNGFAGPRIVSRGHSGFLSIITRMYFIMEEVADEVTLEQAWWRHPQDGDGLLDGLAWFAANLHDAGFIHTDFSERHIFTRRGESGWMFRLIDLERARLGVRNDRRAAADLKTLAVSVTDPRLRQRIEEGFLDAYVAGRTTLSQGTDLRTLFGEATATKSF